MPAGGPRSPGAGPRWRLVAGPASTAAAVLGAWTAVALVDPAGAGYGPVCPLRALTGLDCPLCGGTRAVTALAHGDLGAALDHNVLVTLAVPVAVLLWVRWTWRRVRGDGVPLLALTGGRVVGLLALGLGFALLRNLPFAGPLGSG